MEALLLQKTIGIITKLCDKGLSKAVELVQKAAADQPYMVAEGMPIQIANSTSEYVQKMAFDTSMKGKQTSVTLPTSSPKYVSLDEEIAELSSRLSYTSKHKLSLQHIFEPEIKINKKNNLTISGWHHDLELIPKFFCDEKYIQPLTSSDSTKGRIVSRSRVSRYIFLYSSNFEKHST